MSTIISVTTEQAILLYDRVVTEAAHAEDAGLLEDAATYREIQTLLVDSGAVPAEHLAREAESRARLAELQAIR